MTGYKFRIVRGSVHNHMNLQGKMQGYRSGWWWHCTTPDLSGFGYMPEGPFKSKWAAENHLKRQTIGYRNRDFGEYKCSLIPSKMLMVNNLSNKKSMPLVTRTVLIGKKLFKMREYYRAATKKD